MLKTYCSFVIRKSNNSSLLLVWLAICVLSCKVSERQTNALINEKSPYLLQHAHNPVNWQVWNTATLQKAQIQNKLLVISIGYSACHWCHVMEKESFSDVEVAKLMNQHFVNVKVDREERPDIDQIYMTACQMTNESGCGWPLNVIALPDGKPVWIGSYLPKKEWKEKLHYFLKVQHDSPEKLRNYAEHLKEGIQNATSSVQKAGEGTVAFISKIKGEIDIEDGGLLGIQKFPMPALWQSLLKYETQNPDENLKKSISTTLNRMASGGVYDHIGGGFFRYATDDEWRVPHFEKMLYDNAQLVSLYARASKQNSRYQQIVRETIAFLEQNMQDKSGGFYASLDADSEGKEGKYYTWTKAEIEQVLGNRASDFWHKFELKENVIGRKWDLDNFGFGILKENQSNPKSLLLQDRQKRPKPATDTKIITSWNALMVQGYLDAYRFLGDDVYLQKAQKLADYLLKKHFSKSSLKRLNYGNTQGFLEDYAYLADALLNLYQATYELQYLQQANVLTMQVFKNFKQNEQGFFDSSYSNQLFISSVEITDGVMPSANAVLANRLHDLGVIFQNENYTKVSQRMADNIIRRDMGTGHYYWLNVLMKSEKPPYEVCIVGKNAKVVAKHFLTVPNIILMVSEGEENLPLLHDKAQSGKTMIYVCKNTLCKMPTESVAEALKNIE